MTLEAGDTLVMMDATHAAHMVDTVQGQITSARYLVKRLPDPVVRKCADPQCQKVFRAARPHQIYCSPRCSSRVRQERYRKVKACAND